MSERIRRVLFSIGIILLVACLCLSLLLTSGAAALLLGWL